MRYAKATGVSSARSREHIIDFAARGKRIRFVMALPVKTEPRFLIRKRYGRDATNPPHMVEKLWEQEVRQHWRALALLVKAKLAAVEAGITTFESEFLAHIVIPGLGGKTTTVGEYTLPRIEKGYLDGRLPPLLPGSTEEGP